MKLLAAILALLLSGCGGGPYWIGDSICIGIACTDKSVSDYSMFGPAWPADADRPTDPFHRPILPPVVLYRDDPEEQPAIKRVEVAPGKIVEVNVYARRCKLTDTMEPNYVAYPSPTIYLCGKKGAINHELAHAAGMSHTAWRSTGVANCSTVTASGYKTGYRVGSEICFANDYEWANK